MWSGGMLLNQQYTAVQEVFTTPDSNSTASSSSDTELDSTNTPRALTTINPLANSAVMGVDLYADALHYNYFLSSNMCILLVATNAHA